MFVTTVCDVEVVEEAALGKNNFDALANTSLPIRCGICFPQKVLAMNGSRHR
jgi:hypothetical protein